MKLIFLNIWGGKLLQPLTKFIAESAPTTDFFCFQEVFQSNKRVNIDFIDKDAKSDILGNLKQIIPGYNVSYANTNLVRVDDTEVTYGLAIFHKKNIKIDSEGSITTYANRKEENLLERVKSLQYIRFAKEGKNFTLYNFHGIAYPGDKLDTENRLVQSRKIVEFLDREKEEKILGGDFNLMPQTRSISIIRSSGMRDLIKEFNITSTRSDINYKLYRSTKNLQHFADFAFVSPGINIKSFQVPRLNISDHLPLILSFD